MSRPGLRARVRPTLDTALAAALFLLAVATLHMTSNGTDAWGLGGVALSVALAAVMTQAQARPVLTPVLIVGGYLVAQAAYGLVPVFAMMLVVTVFRAASGDAIARAGTLAAAVLAAVAVDLGALLTRHDSPTDSAYLVMATAVVGAAAAGDAVRNRRAYVHEVEDRARRAEYANDQALQRRVAEVRLSIARDVHDLVAHHLAVISVQSDVADHLVADRPDGARQAIGLTRDAARSALGELGGLIHVLRGGTESPLEPSPTLAHLPELMASFETTGLTIRRRQHGTARPLSAAVDLAAYRVVQESLTNAHKHGGGRADVLIAYVGDALVIDVVNPTAADVVPTTGAGHGLLGMRERVAAVGGTVRIGPSGPDRFRILASLPAAGLP